MPVYLLINWYCSLLVFYLNMWMWNRGGMANPNQDETGWRQIFEVKAVRMSVFTLVWYDNQKVSRVGEAEMIHICQYVNFDGKLETTVISSCFLCEDWWYNIQVWQLFPLYHVEIDFVYIFNVRMYIKIIKEKNDWFKRSFRSCVFREVQRGVCGRKSLFRKG